MSKSKYAPLLSKHFYYFPCEILYVPGLTNKDFIYKILKIFTLDSDHYNVELLALSLLLLQAF